MRDGVYSRIARSATRASALTGHSYMRIFEYTHELSSPPMIDAHLIPEVAARFKALSDEGRLRLLSALQRGEMCVGELAEAVDRPQPNVSQHLASLTHSGLVAARRQGNRAFYRISDPTVLRICEAVCDSLAERGRREGRHATAPPRRRRVGAGR
jgi:DNA-binding transcriptional ArsR family regulator